MQVKVKFFGFSDLPRLIPNATGSSLAVSIADDASLGDLVQTLVDRYGDALRRRLQTIDGKIHPDIKVFLKDTPVENPLGPLLRNQDEAKAEVTIILLGPVQGG